VCEREIDVNTHIHIHTHTHVCILKYTGDDKSAAAECAEHRL
jgi:hypothetical protein